MKCAACAVVLLETLAREHDGQHWHTPCLIRSLQAELDTMRRLYEGLRPHVSDRSVLRGLSRFADLALDSGHVELERDEDAKNALDWLRRAAGWTPLASMITVEER